MTPTPTISGPDPDDVKEMAERIRRHVEYLANTRLDLPFMNWNEISNDFLTSADLLDRLSAQAQPRGALDERQRVVVDWGAKAFGADHMADKIVRAARFIEEAAEFVQAVGLPRDHLDRAINHVYSRPSGDPAQEAGGAANTLMAACAAIGLSLDDCQRKEIERCLAKDPAHFAARNEAKLREVDAPHPTAGPAVREALKPFAAFADVKGGTREAEVLRQVINKILDSTPYPDDINALSEFCKNVHAARTALSLPDDAPRMPEGYVMVPREPTSGMLNTGALFDPNKTTLQDYYRAKDQARISYKAMIEAHTPSSKTGDESTRRRASGRRAPVRKNNEE